MANESKLKEHIREKMDIITVSGGTYFVYWHSKYMCFTCYLGTPVLRCVWPLKTLQLHNAYSMDDFVDIVANYLIS